MVSVRLVFVLAFYACMVAASLITITVVFTALNKKAMNVLVLRQVRVSMDAVKQAAVDQLNEYEAMTYNIAMLLLRLNLTPSTHNMRANLKDYVTTWSLMTVAELAHNSSFISTFSMWLDTTTSLWYMTGCNRETQLCSLYNASTNITGIVFYQRSNVQNPVDMSTALNTHGAPIMYSRYLDSLALHKPSAGHGWWGRLYIDEADSVVTHTCRGVDVAKTIDYFYCTEYYMPEDSAGERACKQIVGVTGEVREAETLEQSSFIAASTLHVTSPTTVDNVNGICNPDADTGDAIKTFISSCKAGFLQECDGYVDVRKHGIRTVLGYARANGASFVIAGCTPHSFFFDLIDHSHEIAVAISVVMIVLVVLMSVVISLSIVVPISYICTSMKHASNLTYERKMAPIAQYTIFSEIKQLCATYLDLRQALRDLKAFMPQGLLVSPDEGADSTSLLSALMGGGRYTSVEGEDDESIFDEDREGSDTDDDIELDMAGRAGGYNTPEAATSVDTYPHSEGTRQSFAQVALSSVATRDEEDDAPLPNQRNRSLCHTGNVLAHSGIVSVVAVNPVDTTLLRDVTSQVRVADRASSRKQSSAAPKNVQGTSSLLQQKQQLQTREMSNHVKLHRTNGSAEAKRVKFRDGCGTLNADSPRWEGTSLRLNRSVYKGDINKFRSVNCTLVCIRFSFKFIDERSLEGEVNQLMNVLIRVILRYGGVIEVFRPDVVVVSFGAHAAMSLHTPRATAAAIVFTKRLTVAQRARTRIVIDTGSFYCGTCGAHGRVSPVLFGDRFDSAVELLRYDLGQGRLVATDRVALCLPSDFVVPFDYIVNLRDRSQGFQLFLVLNPAKRNLKDFRESVLEFRTAYTLASSGRYREALEIVSRGGQFDPELAAYCATTYKYILTMTPPRPRYCRFQLPLFEPLGVTVKDRAPRYQHELLQLNELEADDEEGVSINFGFGGSSSCTAPNANDVCGQSQSHVFDEESNNCSKAFHMNCNSCSGVETDGNCSSATGAALGALQARGHAFSSDSSAAARSFEAKDETTGACANRLSASESWSPIQKADKKKACAMSLLRAGDTGRTDSSDEGLPLVFTNNKGEHWHRFPSMIGKGAFAEVYRAISENGSLVALKCIHLASTNVQLADVVSEVNTSCKLFSDFIVNHIGWAHVGPYMIIIMDYMSGGSLHSALSAFPKGMTLQVVRRYASDAVRGLAYLHRNGVVHADVKPQNILLAADGGCRLSDFGSSVTKANARFSGGDVFHLRGTPSYMSPEVARGDPPSMKSDMWSFGITLYEMLTGRKPWVMKKNFGLPRVPSGIFRVGVDSSANAATATAVAAVANNADGAPLADVSGVRRGNTDFSNSVADRHHMLEKRTSTANGSVEPARLATSLPPLTFDTSAPVEWVPVHGLSDARLVQGIANGSVTVRVEPKDLPTAEAYRLIDACLQDAPQRRPISWEAVDHPFFFSESQKQHA
ncbi:putative protein kinase [Leptomonas seymouri]|uniref:Protein kinase domain-containing protein n=1 Tax=Leptomonas seymouri TaxID=5684 RepID=A0A0N1IJQ3_LEPSE|nr:putative protein kinase [Leptomonas seymouri]|eukprot:KPI85342.1 putative protein kinase [Leptomonas seymouri]